MNNSQTTFEWRVLETVVDNGMLRWIKYRCKASDGQNTVETEGNWRMRQAHLVDAETSEVGTPENPKRYSWDEATTSWVEIEGVAA